MIRQVLCLSTNHLPELVMDIDGDFGDLSAEEHDYGYWLWLPEDEEDDLILPDWLQPIYRMALEEGCSFICFDSDAEEIEGFQSFVEEF